MMDARAGNGGRPPKPEISSSEYEATRGMSARQAARKVAEMRGAFDPVVNLTAGERAKRLVSDNWVFRQRRRYETSQAMKLDSWRVVPRPEGPLQNSVSRDTRPPEPHQGGDNSRQSARVMEAEPALGGINHHDSAGGESQGERPKAANEEVAAGPGGSK